jgi:uncharacterized membrane protein SpoIIM required for sporulation
LARAQTEGWPRPIQEYLNELVGRAHSRVYAAQPRSRIGFVTYFFGVIPTTFRRRWPYPAVSAALSIAVAAAVYLSVRQDPALGHEIFGSFAEAVEEFATSDKPAGHYFAEQPFVRYLGGSAFSAFLFLHNFKIAVLCFAAGVLLGLGTIYLLVANAMMIGTFFAVGANCGALKKLVSVVAPHGALELPAIFIAAGGGLLIAHAIIKPGKWRRADALRLAARDALPLLVSTAPMFLAAGIIEGNLSPGFGGFFNNDTVRFSFAFGVFVLMVLYLLRGDSLLSEDRRRLVPKPPPWP